MSEFVVQCPAEIMFSADDPWQSCTFQCRLPKGHEGNHSTNACKDDSEPGYYPDGTYKSHTDKVTFRLDWRSSEGVTYRRYPKRES